MANSDYTVRPQNNGFCPFAQLSGAIGALQTTLLMTGYSSPIPDGIRIGMAALIDSEIIVVLGQSGNTLTIGRGCCDTVPAPHASGATVWFFDDSIGRDNTTYLGTETISVKVLPRTVSGGAVPIENSPPNGITFGQRFIRPYPPGLLLINGQPFTSVLTLTDDVTPEFVLTWAHRNRVTQQDQMIDHSVGSIAPEAGTTYRIEVYKADNTLVRTVAGLTGTTYTYTRAMCMSDFAVTRALHNGYIKVFSVRDGFDSYQHYRINFVLNAWTKVQRDLSASWMVKQYVQADRSISYNVEAAAVGDSLYSDVILLLPFDLESGYSYGQLQPMRDYSPFNHSPGTTGYMKPLAGDGAFGGSRLTSFNNAGDIVASQVWPKNPATENARFGRSITNGLSIEAFVYGPPFNFEFGLTDDINGGMALTGSGSGIGLSDADAQEILIGPGSLGGTVGWHHVAATCTADGLTQELFYKGASYGTITATYTQVSSVSNFVQFTGQIDSVRVTKNRRYSSGFAPPTADFPRA